MVTVKALDELTLVDLWQVVPHDEDFWEDTKPRLQQMLKHLMQGALEEELTQLLGASRYRRVDGRRGHRNGFYDRDLATQIGIIQGVRVPRARGVPQDRAVFARYQRRQAEVNQLIRDVFLRGVSTREVGRVLESILGERVSAATVSRVARSLDAEVQRFHQQPIGDGWRYLFLDGVYLRVKAPGKVRRRLVLCAFAIGPDGRRRMLDFRLAEHESEAAWTAFLSELRERGLTGEQLRLVAGDGCAGLHAALQAVYPYVPRQHCWAHKLRNVSNLLKRSQQEACISEARRIYQATTRRAAVAAYWAWARRWRGEAPRAVACLERDLDELLAHFACPIAERRTVRTTNAIERCFREVRRRTRPMSCFTNDASCERIIYAIISHLNHTWEGRPSRTTQTS